MEEEKRGLEGTGLFLPHSLHGNLRSTASDAQLKEILHGITSSKTPAVVNYGASWCRVCSQILPAFCRLSNEFPKLSFVTLMNAQKLLRPYDTPRPSIFFVMEKRLMKCSEPEKSGYMIAYGCIHEIKYCMVFEFFSPHAASVTLYAIALTGML